MDDKRDITYLFFGGFIGSLPWIVVTIFLYNNNPYFAGILSLFIPFVMYNFNKNRKIKNFKTRIMFVSTIMIALNLFINAVIVISMNLGNFSISEIISQMFTNFEFHYDYLVRALELSAISLVFGMYILNRWFIYKENLQKK